VAQEDGLRRSWHTIETTRSNMKRHWSALSLLAAMGVATLSNHAEAACVDNFNLPIVSNAKDVVATCGIRAHAVTNPGFCAVREIAPFAGIRAA
jgi:hypothetical protein